MPLAKHSYLYTAFLMTLYLLVPGIGKLLIMIVGILWYYRYYHKGILCFILLFIFLSLKLNIPLNKAEHKTLRIDEIKENYVVASSGKEKSILYGIDHDVALMDIIEVEGNFKRIHSTHNRGMFDFEKYAQRKGIISMMQVDSYEIISYSKSLKSWLYRKIEALSNKEVKEAMQSMLYRIDDGKVSHMVYASGVHLLFVSQFISRLLKVKKESSIIVVSLLYLALFPSHFFVIRILIFTICDILFSKFDKRDRTGIAMIGTMLYHANSIYEVGYLIPVLYRIVFLFRISRISKKVLSLGVLIPIQLYFFHEVNIVQILLFPLFRIIGGVLLLLTIPVLFFPCFSFLFLFLVWIQDILISTLSLFPKVIGKPYDLWVLLWFYTLIQYGSYGQKKYFYNLIFLCFIHMNMTNFDPFGEVTYIDVGQGDCILVKEPFGGDVMMIDVAGHINRNLADTTIYPYLKMRGIKKIDKIVITHDDYDHNGGLKALKKLITVDEVITTPQDIELSRSLFYSLNNQFESNDTNDQSIVLYSEINGLKYLFMGDASIHVEENIMNQWNRLSCDILNPLIFIEYNMNRTSPFFSQNDTRGF